MALSGKVYTVTNPIDPHANWIVFHLTDAIGIGRNRIHSFYCAPGQDHSNKEKYIFHALNIKTPARDASGGGNMRTKGND